MTIEKTKLHPLWKKLWKRPYHPLKDLALCGCLMEVRLTQLEGQPKEVPWIGVWTGPVNAAWNCRFCQGSGLDEDRLAGGLLRILRERIWFLDRISPPTPGYRIHFLHDGKQHDAFGATLLIALLAVFEVVATGENPIIFHEPMVSLEDSLKRTPAPKCAYCGQQHSWGIDILPPGGETAGPKS